MHKILKFQGKTLEKALERASLELKIPERDINYEIITYGSTGIFGLIGFKKAIIKVFLKEEQKLVNEKIESPTDYIKDFVKKTFEEDDEIISEEALKIGKSVLERIVNAITNDTSIKVSKQNHQIIFEVNGGASGVLIGKKGQTLEAMQYIVEKIVNKNSAKRVRILIDVEGYLKKKRENLQRLASKMLDKVRKTKKPVTIGQMNSHDRRIVHTSLKDEQDVRTQSVGSGYYRKLMIFPQKNKEKYKN